MQSWSHRLQRAQPAPCNSVPADVRRWCLSSLRLQSSFVPPSERKAFLHGRCSSEQFPPKLRAISLLASGSPPCNRVLPGCCQRSRAWRQPESQQSHTEGSQGWGVGASPGGGEEMERVGQAGHVLWMKTLWAETVGFKIPREDGRIPWNPSRFCCFVFSPQLPSLLNKQRNIMVSLLLLCCGDVCRAAIPTLRHSPSSPPHHSVMLQQRMHMHSDNSNRLEARPGPWQSLPGSSLGQRQCRTQGCNVGTGQGNHRDSAGSAGGGDTPQTANASQAHSALQMVER